MALATRVHGEWAFADGELVRMSQVAVSPTAHGLHYGTGAFEGIRAYWDEGARSYRVVKLTAHLTRLARSCSVLGIELPFEPAVLADACCELLRRNEHGGDAYLRPVAFKNALMPGTPMGLRLSGVSSRLIITSVAMPSYTPASGYRCMVSSWRKPAADCLPPGVKATGGYLPAALAADEAHAAGCDDALMCNPAGQVAEATTANVFMVTPEGGLVTPPASAGILLGCTRAAVIELLGRELGLTVTERDIAPAELFDAAEVFLTGTAQEVVAVVAVDGAAVGGGAPGPVASAARDLYAAAVAGRMARYAPWLTVVSCARATAGQPG